jgi:hypothetical protein
MIQFATYPKSEPTVRIIKDVVGVMQQKVFDIASETHDTLHSNDVLAHMREGLEALGFKVETDKSAAGKIKVPVLFGRNGAPEKTFEADAFHEELGVVLEVEAGRAVVNNQFLKDLFQACMMQEARHLVIAVRNVYRGAADFDKVIAFFETLYASARLQLPLKSVTIIGY